MRRYRPANEHDVPSLVGMLADDPLGVVREGNPDAPEPAYFDAFQAIDQDPNNLLIVVEQGQELVGMLQLTFIPYLTHLGAWRCLIEGVRVKTSYRGQGIGREMFSWAIEQAGSRGCRLVQLTSNKARPDAIRFYEDLGFVASHEGFKLDLEQPRV